MVRERKVLADRDWEKLEKLATYDRLKKMIKAPFKCKLCGELLVQRQMHFVEDHKDVMESYFEAVQDSS